MRTCPRTRVTARLALAGLALVALAACVDSSSVDESGPPAELASRSSVLSREERIYRSVAEAMPFVTYVVDGRADIHVADLYVRGHVTDVIEGRSFIWEFDGDTEIRHEVRFNADQAKASTVHLVVEPSRSIDPSGDVASSDPVIVGVSFDAPVDMAAIRKEFTSTGEIVLLLYDSSEVLTTRTTCGRSSRTAPSSDSSPTTRPSRFPSSMRWSALTT